MIAKASSKFDIKRIDEPKTTEREEGEEEEKEDDTKIFKCSSNKRRNGRLTCYINILQRCPRNEVQPGEMNFHSTTGDRRSSK